MNKSEILKLNDTELFIMFHTYTIGLVHETNSSRGETKKTAKEFNWIVDECVKRFNLDKEMLVERTVI